jgi:hypothetical protein
MDELTRRELAEIATCIEIVRAGQVAKEVREREFQKRMIYLFEAVMTEAAKRD